jgi:hypothetical protein
VNVAGIKPTLSVEEERATNPEPVKPPPPGELQITSPFFAFSGCDGFDRIYMAAANTVLIFCSWMVQGRN